MIKIILPIFIIFSLNVKFGVSQYSNKDYGYYNVTDLKSDIKSITKTLTKYKAKEHSQLMRFQITQENEVEKYFTDRKEGSIENYNKNNTEHSICITKFHSMWEKELQRGLHQLKICSERVIDLSFNIPLEDTDYLAALLGGNFSSNIEAMVKDCEYWTTESSQKISMEDCYALKSPLLQMLSSSYQNVIIALKKLVLNSTLETVSSIKNCVSVTRQLLESHWSLNTNFLKYCLF